MTFVEKRNLKLLLFATWRTSGYSLCWAVILWLSRSWIISPVPVRGPVRWWWPAGSAWVKVPYWRSVRGLVARKTSTRWDKTHWRQNVVFRKKNSKNDLKKRFFRKKFEKSVEVILQILAVFCFRSVLEWKDQRPTLVSLIKFWGPGSIRPIAWAQMVCIPDYYIGYRISMNKRLPWIEAT